MMVFNNRLAVPLKNYLCTAPKIRIPVRESYGFLISGAS